MANYLNKELRDFSVQAYQNEEFKEVTLDSIKGKWSIFFFYPGDFTFVCPTELEDLQNIYEDFKKADAEVYGVSTDSEHVHKAWHDASERISKVEYPLLSDRTHKLSKQFGVLGEDGNSQRGAFIINPDGIIRAYEISAGGVGRNAHEILRKLKACQFVENNDFGGVCPANWTEGDDTLTTGIDQVGKL